MQHIKHYITLCCAVLFCATSFSQSSPVDMTGLWTGLMFNDTTELNYRYEIAISEKKGKLIGYSQTFFIIDGKEYYGMKKIKITIEGEKVITQDLKLLDNNYPSTIKIPKGVYVLNVLNFERKDTVMILSGVFTTNRTKQYSPVTGYIHVERKTNFRQSPLITQLEKQGLADELSFVEAEKLKEIAGSVSSQTETVKKSTTEKAGVKEVSKKTTQHEPVIVKTAEPKSTQPAQATVKTEERKSVQQDPVKVKTEETKTMTAKPVQAGADINNRVIETIQSVNYASDSLVLTLYDNGEIDGDTVSVLLNGDVVMPKVGLSTNAVRKTIYTKDLPDTIQLVMYAETLGSLPPNTGLLIVYDGTVRYEIRFSGDLKKNAAIVFRRKRNAD